MRPMKRRVTIAMLLVLAGALAGFGITFAARSAAARHASTDPAAEALLEWLQVPAERRNAVLGRDADFATDLSRLRGELTKCRSELAEALEAADATDELVRARSEAVIAAGAALERRVTGYLLSIRQHLTPEQRKRLFGLCADGVRQGRGWQWRHGQSAEWGRGMGRGYRGGRNPVELHSPTSRPATSPGVHSGN